MNGQKREKSEKQSIPVILASASPARRKVLFDAGICPEIRESHVDEDAVLRAFAEKNNTTVDDFSTEQRVRILAQAKAQAVFDMYAEVSQAAKQAQGERIIHRPLEVGDKQNACEPISAAAARMNGQGDMALGPVLIACDSMFELGGKSFGKPHTPQVARERLQQMSGKTGILHTGSCVIDMASGKRVVAVTSAEVMISAMSDSEIDAYIATGEPLEVAGCFTLEGFGGAFISGIVGEPSCVLGLSLSATRAAVKEFGIEWTDLWNVEPVEKLPVNPDNPLAPATNVKQPGDGWIDCACGRRHWGLNGAAGILLARRGETGEVTDVVLQHRALWSAEGGTWAVPGGAAADGETPLEGALRESFEEANIHPGDIDVVGSYVEDHGPWSYTTVLAFEKLGHSVDPHPNDDESIDVRWVPIDEVDKLPLLRAFGHDWPEFRKRLKNL
jgi:septum formation protein